MQSFGMERKGTEKQARSVDSGSRTRRLIRGIENKVWQGMPGRQWRRACTLRLLSSRSLSSLSVPVYAAKLVALPALRLTASEFCSTSSRIGLGCQASHLEIQGREGRKRGEGARGKGPPLQEVGGEEDRRPDEAAIPKRKWG